MDQNTEESMADVLTNIGSDLKAIFNVQKSG